MLAAIRSRYGGPDVIELRTVDVPRPEAGQVLVQVRAASVNRIDHYELRGSPFMSRLVGGLRRPKEPGLGHDFAGDVVAVAADVSEPRVGDAVFGSGIRAFAEYVAVKAEGVVAKPPSVSYEHAAAVPVAGLTALQGLRKQADLRPGQRVLVTGAGGGVGGFAVRIAKALGKQDDAERYARLAQSIREAFNRRFLQPGTGKYDTGSQACQSFALFMGLVPDAEREKALQVLVDDVLITHKGHLTTGIFGTKYLLDVLTSHGRADVAYTIVNQRDFPGWGHMLENGATTLWEHWAFSDNTYSHNHPMFGSVSEWFIKGVAGIQPDPDAVGFDRVIIRPNPVGDLTEAAGSYQSIRGKIECTWRKRGGKLAMFILIPPNASATVHVPAARAADVTDGRGPASTSPGVKFLRMEKGAAIYQVGSGNYAFEAPIGA